MAEVVIDETDLRILTTLQQRGRISNTDMADEINMSVGACSMRMRRLEKEGIILSYTAFVDLARLGPYVMTYMKCTLSNHASTVTMRFEQSLRSMDEVTECYLISGGCDYLLKVITRSVNDYADFVERLMASDIGLSRYSAYIVINSRKEEYSLMDILSAE